MKCKIKQNIYLLKYRYFLANKVIKLRITMNIKQIVFLLNLSLVRHSILWYIYIIYLSLILQLYQFGFLYVQTTNKRLDNTILLSMSTIICALHRLEIKIVFFFFISTFNTVICVNLDFLATPNLYLIFQKTEICPKSKFNRVYTPVNYVNN